MMEFIRKMYKENKKLPIYLIAAVALGAAILILGRLANEPEGTRLDILLSDGQRIPDTDLAENYIHNPEPTHPTEFTYERALEIRLEEFFSVVEGAGRVRVMVSPMAGRETVFAVDTTESRSYSTEADAQGGSRETHQHSNQQQTVMVTDRAGSDRPLVLREIEPRIEGIVIIAEGGDSPFVRDALTRAARAMLGLEAHMIQVLTMKSD